MTRGVALPPPRLSTLPIVWAEHAAQHGVLAALSRIEDTAAHMRCEADRQTVKGHHDLAAVYLKLAAEFDRDALFFVEVHA